MTELEPETIGVDNLSIRAFRRLSAALIGLSSLLLLQLVREGTVGTGYQGDEGARVFDAYQAAFRYPNSLYGSVWEATVETFFGIHPPGDMLVRAGVARTADLIGLNTSPVSVMFALSIVAVGVAHFIAAEIGRRAGGPAAGALTLFLLFGSFVFNDIKVSSMGEAIAMPFLLGGLLLVQRVVIDPPRFGVRGLSIGGGLVALSTFIRPEPSLLLPGLCLALWFLIGFWRATLFGAVAGSFEAAKLVHSTAFAGEDDLSVLNVGSAYFNGTQTLGTLWRSDFMQQLVHEPAVLIFPLGVISSIAFLASRRDHSDPAWRTHLFVFAGTMSYLAINVVAQLTGLSPHASYRIVIASGPTMIISFALAFVGVARILKPWLVTHLGDDSARIVAVSALVLLCGWGAYDFMTDEVSALQARVPDGVRTSAEDVLARSEPDDAIYVDRMQYWENGLLGYFGDRDAPVCNYARCSAADEDAMTLWLSQRTETPVAGTTTYGEFNTLRMHTFIDVNEPSHIVIAAEDIQNNWTRVASGLWGEEAPLWSSHIIPYLDGEIDYTEPREQYLRLGSINGIEYFESYVFLLPRSRNNVGIVYEAFYGREPEQGV